MKKIFKEELKILGFLSLILLICVLIGQGIWLKKIRDVTVRQFWHTTTFILSEITDSFLNEESIDSKYHFSCGLKPDGLTFTWGTGNSVKISSSKRFHEMTRLVFYDHLYKNHLLNLSTIISLYQNALNEKGIKELPVLMILDKTTGKTLMTSDAACTLDGKIVTNPIGLGYEYKHQLIAVFNKPLIFRSMMWHLVGEVVFLIGFVCCLFLQWRIMKMTWQSAKVQTLGAAHLEHELKKPLAAMISAIRGIVNRGRPELSSLEEWKLKMVEMYLLKMSEVTDTMLISLKTSRLEIKRRVIDIKEELGLIVNMFTILKPNAKVSLDIAEDLDAPLLDSVYFNYMIINLIDNGIKYGGEAPEVEVTFRKEGQEYVLTVADHGIGIPLKEQKRIFRQFYRVKDQSVTRKTGFGLGLAFVKKVVIAYGGKIFVESRSEKGSKFIVKLPDENGKL